MTEAVSAGFLDSFGVNWKQLLAELVNFGVIVFILSRWVFKPVLKTIDDRNKKIEEGVASADLAKKQLADAEAHKQALVAEAKKEARALVMAAKQEADAEREGLKKETQVELDRQLEEAKERLQHEKSAMLQQAKQEVADMVIRVTDQVVAKTIDAKAHRALIQQAIDGLEK